ncbi:MAG: glycosyltransferase family 4 protein, partial [Burkholderiales bacterium]|nr:glycosyltransferase family 4 protein [Burkholderiales bacterium]
NVLAVTTRFWPDQQVIRKHLDQFKNRKAVRILAKIKVYCQAVLNRGSLIDIGLLPKRNSSLIGSASLTAISQQLRPEDTYVSLGTGWNDPSGCLVAERHRSMGGRTVQMIHDLIPIVRPDLHMDWVCSNFQAWLDRVSQCTTLFLCVSQNTANDLSNYLSSRRRAANVAVTPLAHEFPGFQRGQIAAMPLNASEPVISLKDKRFVICVGSIEQRKNGTRLIEAWTQAIKQQPEDGDVALIFCGKRSWGLTEFDKALESATQQGFDIRVIENTSDEELAWLYSHCSFTVYVSLYEGWGLPVGESLWFHKRCLASQTSSVPEVGGPWVIYCEPERIDSITAGLSKLLAQSKLASEGASLDIAHLRQWSDHARDVMIALRA